MTAEYASGLAINDDDTDCACWLAALLHGPVPAAVVARTRKSVPCSVLRVAVSAKPEYTIRPGDWSDSYPTHTSYASIAPGSGWGAVHDTVAVESSADTTTGAGILEGTASAVVSGAGLL